MNKMLIIAALMSVTIGCSSTQTYQASAENKPKPQDIQLYEKYVNTHQLPALEKITAFKFQGWRSLDNEHLIINTSPQRPYLITLKSKCFDLKRARGIAINSNGTNTLHAGFDSITIPDFPKQKCFIKSIYRLTSDQAREVSKLGKSQKV